MPKKVFPLLSTMDDILNRAREISSIGEPYRVAVAAAHDHAAIDAAVQSQKEGLAESTLVGDSGKICEIIESSGGDVNKFKIIDSPDDVQSANIAAELASTGEANVVLKGLLGTSTLLKSILAPKYGLRRKGLLSHTAILSPKKYHKLLGITDGGMVIKPTFSQKVEMIRNAALVGWALGIEKPRIAVLTPIDYIVEAFPETFEAAALSKMAHRGQIKNCIVDGPMSFDTAVWKKAVEYQEAKSDVAGNSDILLTGSIEEGNITAKSLIQFGGAAFAGIIMGANVPIALVSRADPGYFKLASMALSVVVAHYLKEK